MIKKMGCLFLLFVFFSCAGLVKDDVGDKKEKGADVNFFNESSFMVDIYRNINPSKLDKSTLPIATVPAGSVLKVRLPESVDKRVGDVFYIRYYVQIADSFNSGTDEAIYVKVERSISNISVVIEEGKTYTQTIAQPAEGELTFGYGYIKVQNTASAVLQVMSGDAFLHRLGKKNLNLEGGKCGFYEFDIPSTQENVTLTNLKIFVTSTGKTLNVPSFVLERGKLYNFLCDAREVIGPHVEKITY